MAGGLQVAEETHQGIKDWMLRFKSNCRKLRSPHEGFYIRDIAKLILISIYIYTSTQIQTKVMGDLGFATQSSAVFLSHTLGLGS